MSGWALAFRRGRASPAADRERALASAPVPPCEAPSWPQALRCPLAGPCVPGAGSEQQGGLPLFYPCLVSPHQVKVAPGGSQPHPLASTCISQHPLMFSGSPAPAEVSAAPKLPPQEGTKTACLSQSPCLSSPPHRAVPNPALCQSLLPHRVLCSAAWPEGAKASLRTWLAGAAAAGELCTGGY